MASLCGVSINTVRRYVQDEKMPADRTPGGHLRFDLVAVLRWYADRNLRPPAALREASFIAA